MTAKLYVTGVVGEDIKLMDIIRQFKSYKNPTDIEVIIDSNGGYVSEGRSIFNFLRNQKLPVKTIAKKAYSIASVIWMAGDHRMVEAGKRKVMIHNPWMTIQGGARELKEASEALATMEQEFVVFYSQYIDLDTNSISDLLLKETFLSSEEALDLGFAHEVFQPQLQAMALLGDVNNNNEDENKTIMKNVENFYNTLKNFFKEDEVVNLIVQDVTGREIKFPELELGQSPEEGNIAEIDGLPAEGEALMPEGHTFVFLVGKLVEVIQPEEAPVEEEETPEEEQPEAHAEAGEDIVDEVEAPADTVSEVEEAQEEVVETMEQVDIDALITQLEESIFNRVQAHYQTENEALKTEIANLKKSIGGSDVDVPPSTTQRQTNQGGSFLTDALRGR